MGWLSRLFRPTAVGSICGHLTKLNGEISAFGETIKMRINLKKDGTTPYCIDCLGKMSVRCGWCGKPIFIADAITLYSPTSTEEFNARWKEDFPYPLVEDEATGLHLPETAVAYPPTEGRTRPTIVGCARADCSETNADCCGIWLPGRDGKGRVKRFPTPYDILFSDPTITAVIR